MTKSTIQTAMQSLNGDLSKAEEIMYMALAYEEFKGDPMGYIEAHEYSHREGIEKYEQAKECYEKVKSTFGKDTGEVLTDFKIDWMNA